MTKHIAGEMPKYPGYMVTLDCGCNMLGFHHDLERDTCSGCGRSVKVGSHVLTDFLLTCAHEGCGRVANAVAEGCLEKPVWCMKHALTAAGEYSDYLNALDEGVDDPEPPKHWICPHGPPGTLCDAVECEAIELNVIKALLLTDRKGNTSVAAGRVRTSKRKLRQFDIEEEAQQTARARLAQTRFLSIHAVRVAANKKRHAQAAPALAFCMASLDRLGEDSVASQISQIGLPMQLIVKELQKP